MKNCIATIFLALFFILGFTGISYADDIHLEIELLCPVSVAPGDSLTVGMKVTNYSPFPVNFKRAMTGIIGNPSDSGGLPVIYGPWHQPLPNITLLPGESRTIGVRITDAVDTLLDGTVVGATVTLLDDKGQPLSGDACAVAVETPLY